MKKTQFYQSCVFAFLFALTTFATNAQTVFINEIHYDNSGSDVAEAIEIAGPAGTDLNGWKIELYNGKNGAVYNTLDLTEILTNDAQGYGFSVLNLPTNGLQNGAPDGLALIDATNTVIQFLSYEGVVTAVNGIANGQTSTDIGVSESSSTAIGASLQLTGTGNTAADFSWEAFSANTYDTINTGQSFGGIVPSIPPNILINELDADTVGSDMLEFIELYDGGKGNTSLDGLLLVFFNGNNNQSYRTISLSGLETTETGYFVIGNEGVENVNFVIPNNSIQNGADAIVLYKETEMNFPNGTGIETENIIDAIVYGTNDADDLELLTLLNQGQLQLNESINSKQDVESLQRIENGTGGARNTETYQAAAPTPGLTNNLDIITPPPSTEIIPIVAARNTALGTTVTITGTLTVSDQFGGAAYIQDKTGGIAVFDERIHGQNNFAIGDSITITGVRDAFQDQIQLSSLTTIVANGVAQKPIVPLVISLSELEQHSGELVQLTNVSFPNPGDLLFGNSNFILRDRSGEGALWIDNEVALVGLAQPTTCDTVIGVVSRFRDFYQLLPRETSDLPCAEAYVPLGGTSTIAKEDTFDIATWNIEWFGDEGNSPASGSPMSDAIQRDSVRTILKKLDADVIAVEEIADDVLFRELVDGLDGYEYILSDAVSSPESSGVKQKVGFIYKTSVVTPKTTRAMFRSIHPAYNGGDTSVLSQYPEGAADRFYASGRLPFLMTADVTLNGKTEVIDLIALHARANNSRNPQQRYDFRKFDVEVLKDSLDTNFAERNVIVLGDYNDDVDETVADVATTVSTFQSFVEDMQNYTIVTKTLSDAGFRSFVSRENMIDHIMISNELNDNYVQNSADVGYQFYDNDYSNTVSDHLLVTARLFIGATEEDQNAITGFTLVNAASNQIIGALENGAEIDVTSLGTSYLSFIAQTSSEKVGSVALTLDGPVSGTRIENSAPYTMFGDIPNLFFGKTLLPGSYTLTATPYTQKLKGGIAGEVAQIQFTITTDDTSVVLAPNPIQHNEIVLHFTENTESTFVSYRLMNAVGMTLVEEQLTINAGEKSLRFDTSNVLVDKGIYYLILYVNGQEQRIKVLK